jgi:DNA/RNA endonuclease YhcR with UshA esterase domain
MTRAASSKFFPAILRFLMAGLLLGGFTLPALAQNNPVPLINQPLVPDAVAPGGSAFTLTVNGTGFVAGSVVNWNGSARTTAFVSGSQITASILASDIALPGTGWVTVVNATPGGGTSNVAFLSITNSTATVGFRLASSPSTGNYPSSVAVGDFNGDGKLDLAVANLDSDTVSILLGDGAGNFTLASSPSTGNYPSSVAVGDFNGDGKEDLAVANYGSNTVSVFLGDGTGNFSLASSPATGSNPESVAVGDFNRDGNLDLAVANENDAGTVSILLGNGTGNFTLVSSPATGSFPFSVAVGDFNGDGILDLAVANNDSGTVSILLGDGTGNFTLASSPATGNLPHSVAVGDFNGDGKLDLAVANNDSNTVSILLGDGTGNFTLASSPGTGESPNSVVVGDFNGDGILDLAVANFGPCCEHDGTISILLGDGTGNFNLATSPGAGTYSTSVAVGDFNGDGKLDLAVANATSNTVSSLLQAPAVTLSPSMLTFSAQIVGTTSAPQTATLTNVGYATVNISGITIGGSDPKDFAETNNCGPSLAVAASCTITITFTPVTGNTRTATLSISDTGANNPQTISLTGTGLAVKLSATNLNFGKVMLGEISQPQIVVLTNIGSTTLRITSISVGGTDKGDFLESNTCGNNVSAGGTCSVIVRFIPTGKGARTATVGIVDNGGGSPQMIRVGGTGT